MASDKQNSNSDILGILDDLLKNENVSITKCFDCPKVLVKKEKLIHVITLLKESTLTKFSQLIDICGVDFPDKFKRFEVVYNLLSISHNQRIRLFVEVDEVENVPSIVSLYSAANWYEREVWDMYGIKFKGHPDLRRLLTDYGFHGHPLRKDFPLFGNVEVRYDFKEKRVVYEPVKLTQSFRTFDFESPWEGENENNN